MIDVFDFAFDHPRFAAITARGADLDSGVGEAVSAILTDIRQRGGNALLECVRRFDWPDAAQDALRVRPTEIDAAMREVEPEFLATVREAADNITRFHKYQMRHDYTHDDGDGVCLSKRVLPLSRVGVYCPAGTAPLFSCLLMNVLPARIAGVPSIAVAIPAARDGSISPYMLATAGVLELDEIWRMGGAHAIAALAYGAGPVRRVDKIVGPGNAYVAMAKRRVFGTVGIDSVAGPSEIVVIADDSANPEFIAADMLSQVEHGSGYEAGVVLAADRGLAQAVAEQVRTMAARLGRTQTIERALARYGAVFVCSSLDEAAEAANAIAPEHLEIVTRDPRELLPKITNAGAVFLGAWSPEPVGDYFAGTNHVLPTTGAARFSSSLGVADFLKDMSVIEYSRERLAAKGQSIMLMAQKEGLDAHANAVRVRLDAIAKS